LQAVNRSKMFRHHALFKVHTNGAQKEGLPSQLPLHFANRQWGEPYTIRPPGNFPDGAISLKICQTFFLDFFLQAAIDRRCLGAMHYSRCEHTALKRKVYRRDYHCISRTVNGENLIQSARRESFPAGLFLFLVILSGTKAIIPPLG
jgi:hypothetical protein